MPMLRFIWAPLTQSLALKSTNTPAERLHRNISMSMRGQLGAVATASAAARPSIFRPHSTSRRQSDRRKFITTQAPPAFPAGRFGPSPILLDEAR